MCAGPPHHLFYACDNGSCLQNVLSETCGIYQPSAFCQHGNSSYWSVAMKWAVFLSRIPSRTRADSLPLTNLLKQKVGFSGGIAVLRGAFMNLVRVYLCGNQRAGSARPCAANAAAITRSHHGFPHVMSGKNFNAE